MSACPSPPNSPAPNSHRPLPTGLRTRHPHRRPRRRAPRHTRQQLATRPDELTQAIADEPSAPDPALLNEVTAYLTEIISTGTSNQRKALVEALVGHVIITGSDRLVPVFRIPNPDTTPGPRPRRLFTSAASR